MTEATEPQRAAVTSDDDDGAMTELLAWDDVTWDNTHTTGENGVDAHVGTLITPLGFRYLALRLGSDNDGKPHQTIALEYDDAERLVNDLKLTMRSLI